MAAKEQRRAVLTLAHFPRSWMDFLPSGTVVGVSFGTAEPKTTVPLAELSDEYMAATGRIQPGIELWKKVSDGLVRVGDVEGRAST